MTRLLPFLARLVAVSLLLLPVQAPARRGYLALVGWCGASGAQVYDSLPNLYTFLVLILGTPRLPLQRRLGAVAAGLVAFFGFDLFMTAVWPVYLKTPWPSLQNMAFHYGWQVLAHYLLPFLLWFAFAFREIEAQFKGGAPTGRRATDTNSTAPPGSK